LRMPPVEGNSITSLDVGKRSVRTRRARGREGTQLVRNTRDLDVYARRFELLVTPNGPFFGPCFFTRHLGGVFFTCCVLTTTVVDALLRR
jgi:hypothetical protein